MDDTNTHNCKTPRPTCDTILLLAHIILALWCECPQSLCRQELLLSSTAAAEQSHIAWECTRRNYFRLVFIIDAQFVDGCKNFCCLVAVRGTMTFIFYCMMEFTWQKTEGKLHRAEKIIFFIIDNIRLQTPSEYDLSLTRFAGYILGLCTMVFILYRISLFTFIMLRELCNDSDNDMVAWVLRGYQ